MHIFIINWQSSWNDLSCDVPLKGYDYGSFTYFSIVKYKLLNKIEKQWGRNIV